MRRADSTGVPPARNVLKLGHHADAGWSVEVASHAAGETPPPRWMLERELAMLSDDRGGAELMLASRYYREHGVSDLAGREPEDLTLIVDAAPVAFQALRRGRAWIAWTTLGETTITINATGVAPDQVHLARLESLKPYEPDLSLVAVAPRPRYPRTGRGRKARRASRPPPQGGGHRVA